MSKKEEIEKSLKNEIQQYDEYLEGAKDIADVTVRPRAEERSSSEINICTIYSK